LPLINAVGVNSDYFSKNPITAYPGETKDVVFGRLQNMVGEKDLILKAEIIEGNEIATILDKNAEYSVPFGQSDIPVNIHLAIPSTVPVGTNYNINIRFLEYNSFWKHWTVSLSSSTSIRIPVVVVEKPLPPVDNSAPIPAQEPEKNTGNVLWALIGIILIIVNNNCCLPYS